jgi:hypothetical protein
LHALRAIPAPLRSAIGAMFGYPKDVLAMQPGPMLAERLLARPLKELMPIVRSNWFDAAQTTQLFQERWGKFSILKFSLPAGRQEFSIANDPIRAFMEFDRHLWLVDESLRLSDAVTMASGLECRVPFLEPLIIAASQGTESRWQLGLWTTKKLLKETYYPLLPPCIRSIGKASFYPPLAKWLRRECGPLVEETIAHPRTRELFDMDQVARIFVRHKSHETYALHTLATLTQLRCWFETVYDA